MRAYRYIVGLSHMSHINPRCNTAYSGNIDLHWNIRLILLLPLGFLYSDAAMYLAHRYQQHRKVKFQEIVFEMHSVWHHGMFSNNKMHVDSIRLYFALFTYRIAFLVGLLQSDIGWILLFSVALHSMWYEIVHTISHLENPPILKGLANHHKTRREWENTTSGLLLLSLIVFSARGLYELTSPSPNHIVLLSYLLSLLFTANTINQVTYREYWYR